MTRGSTGEQFGIGTRGESNTNTNAFGINLIPYQVPYLLTQILDLDLFLFCFYLFSDFVGFSATTEGSFLIQLICNSAHF